MLNNFKEIKKLEKKISKIEDEIPDEYDIRIIAEKVIDENKDELEELYTERAKVREETWNFMKEHLDAYAAEYMKELIEKKVKDIEDKLIVELARKAMNMEEKNENTN